MRRQSDAEYAVKPNGRQLMDRYRGDEIWADCFVVTKFIPSSNELTEYQVRVSTFGEECTCPGGRHPDCKHRKMVRGYRDTHPDN